MNKRKIINDPVYGFISIPTELIFELISHPYFQRLRRIKQMGLAEFVYTGATHTRFQHALGAMFLMGQAIDVLRSKNVEVSEHEKESVQIAILLHDLGHGPFSHVLEHTILDNVAHEDVSLVLMNSLNRQFNGSLVTAIEMFKGTYHRPFFNQLISSQLDIDRLDYLNRDSFFSGVVEGTIGVERIIKMMCVVNEQLAIEEKGILSIDNFLNARRIMYWQVYLHKTSIAADVMLKTILSIAKSALRQNVKLNCSDTLDIFMKNEIRLESFADESVINNFIKLDDVDLWYSLKSWCSANDPILSLLCQNFLDRKLFKIKFLQENSIQEEFSLKMSMLSQHGIPDKYLKYFVHTGEISNKAYVSGSRDSTIKIAMKNGDLKDIIEASDLPTIQALSNIVKKSYLSWGNPLYLRLNI